MTSGNVRMGPDPDEVLGALEKATREDPGLRDRSAEEVSRELARGGYLPEEPDPVLVAEMLGKLEDQGPRDAEDDLSTEEASPT